MSLSAVYHLHRLQLCERNAGTLVQTMKLHMPNDVEDVTDLERVWQAEVGDLLATVLRGDRSDFDQQQQHDSNRRST